MNKKAHEHLEEWVMRFGGTALLGYLCCLLIFGKGLHHTYRNYYYSILKLKIKALILICCLLHN